jgi:hypothetical protein
LSTELRYYDSYSRGNGTNSTNSKVLPGGFRDGVLKIKAQGRIDDLIIADIKNHILSDFGETGLRRLLVWFFTVYRSDSPGWADWKTFLEVHYDYECKEKLKAAACVDDNQIILLEKYRDYCFYWEENDEDVTAKMLKSLRLKNLDSLGLWDYEFMKEHNQTLKKYDINDISEKTDVFMHAIKAISMNRFQIGWEGLWSHFTAEQKHKIVQVGENLLNAEINRTAFSPEILAIIDSISHPSYFLPHPDTLIRYIYW